MKWTILNKYYYMRLNEWHHMYLGIILAIAGIYLDVYTASFWWAHSLKYLGYLIILDDLYQHFIQGKFIYALAKKRHWRAEDYTENAYRVSLKNYAFPHSPLHKLYQNTIARVGWVIAVNRWFDKLFK